MKTKQELQDLFVQNEQIKFFQSIFGTTYSSWKLVGGAVVDILEGRIPKDYDFINVDPQKFYENGFSLVYETKYSTTLKNEQGVICQFLKNNDGGFEYTISRSAYNFQTKSLEIDLNIFNSKILVPVNFTDSQRLLNCLVRLPHWEKKGYTLPKQTYYSILNTLAENMNIKVPNKHS